jgi:hypothetical protein
VGVVLSLCVLGLLATPPASAQTFTLQISASPDRSSPAALEGRTVSGIGYVFVTPATGAAQVRFFVDDPAMAGPPRLTDAVAPFDLAGTNKNGTARPFDFGQLANGTHTVTAAVDLSAGGAEVATSTFTVDGGSPPPAGSSVLVSTAPDRSSPVELEGQTLSGDAYVFVGAGTGIAQVRFFVDDPTMAGLPDRTDAASPYDLIGSAKGGAALPYDTTVLADGSHSVTAAVDLSAGGTEVVTASFTTANHGASLILTPTTLAFSVQAGQTAAEPLSVVASGDQAVAFTVDDDAAWLTADPASGTTPAVVTASVDAAGLSDGVYAAAITAAAPDVAPAQVAVTLTVGTPPGADQVHLAWVEDPATTMTVVWRTLDPTVASTAQVRPAGTTAWTSATGAPRPSGTAGTLHEVTLRSLSPSTAYDYRVADGGGTWSEVFTTRTAPAAGPATFDVVYVADTGVIGRPDGLATGTEQVIDEIVGLDPHLVLLGGDYVSYDSDPRFASLDDAIDAWFEQMEPIGSRAPMMVSYGNHEIKPPEGFGPWSARFATPSGVDGRRTYSFTVGDVHFVAIFAVNDNTGLSSSTLAWIEQDIVAARAAGARWIIPFFHASPFADGTSHPSNLALRAQLGPLFESLDVPLVVSSHDQSYERTFPLTDVPAANTPTSASLSCYTQDDGVVWVKVSPGGKLSNEGGWFSTFTTHPAPPWTAVRDDTMHHFLRLRVSAGGAVLVQAFGVTGDGSPPVVLDAFTITLGACQ